MKIGLFADGVWGLQTLSLLLKKKFKISFVVLRFKKKNNEFEIKNLAKKNKIDVKIFKDINKNSSIRKIKSYDFDIFISISYNQIFKENFLKLPILRSINCHAGLLPKYRGRNIINWALINGEKKYGITVHYIDSGIDTGDIIYQKKMKIYDHDNYKSLLDKANKECPKSIIKALNLIKKPNFKPIKQSTYGNSFYCRGRIKGDEFINWNLNSKEIHNFIRALSIPGLYARSKYRNTNIKFLKSKLIKYNQNDKSLNGQILFLKEYLIIKTKDGAIKITEYKANKKLKVGNILN